MEVWCFRLGILSLRDRSAQAPANGVFDREVTYREGGSSWFMGNLGGLLGETECQPIEEVEGLAFTCFPNCPMGLLEG